MKQENNLAGTTARLLLCRLNMAPVTVNPPMMNYRDKKVMNYRENLHPPALIA
jgi:hypothetical protein